MKWEFRERPFIDISDSFLVQLTVFHVTYHCTTHAAHVDQLIWSISEPRAALIESAEMWKLEHDFFALDDCSMFPRSRVIGSTHRVTDAWTDKKFMDLPIPSPKHIIPNHPFYFFALGKKVVDGKNLDQFAIFLCVLFSTFVASAPICSSLQ